MSQSCDVGTLFNCALAYALHLKTDFVPCIGVTQGGCALILTTKCHCSLVPMAES